MRLPDTGNTVIVTLDARGSAERRR